MDAVHEMLGFIFFKKEKAEKRVDTYFWPYDQDIESKQKGIFFPSLTGLGQAAVSLNSSRGNLG